VRIKRRRARSVASPRLEELHRVARDHALAGIEAAPETEQQAVDVIERLALRASAPPALRPSLLEAPHRVAMRRTAI